MGVSLAVRKLDDAVEARREGQGLYTLGPIIHNPALVADYEARGAHCLRDHSKAESGATVIIRAHGLPRLIEEDLALRGLKIIDATCPKVKAAQMAIKKARESGRGALLLFGEVDHPEVRGLLSYAGDDALIFNSLEELAALPLDAEKNYFIAAQTTQDKEIFARALDWLSARLGKTAHVLRTICDATRQRQNDVIRLTEQVGSMVIVGGMNSGNTRRLAEIARARGVFTVHCEGPDELPLDKLRELQPIGLSAGASTPDSQINAVESILINL
jgi:4-hydroxy-3-methylbut-2-enyl diphosphate reductase